MMRIAFIALAVGLSAGLLMIYPKLTEPPVSSFISADDEMRRLLQDQAEQRVPSPAAPNAGQGGKQTETMPAETKPAETKPSSSQGDPVSTTTKDGKADASFGKLNLNTATAEQLDELPGIGPSRAQAILELRKRLGGKFRSSDQLLEVKGIGGKTLEKIKPHVTVEP
ncbi:MULTISPECIES: helix-hairpin-helix domain-containing protein [unclassified Paenibacillus]|uniref:ComEA family DNA-binding protein n=1 Tax=unclassified Paenibacillus TaxID=185978 RepID=UPI001AE7128F|nr:MULTISPECIES: helix-hairpin-helix domain-containing protein [unclassified Paenibacillus]MBP1156379.1 competence protein ComEA [Paenibacillus sp. PvP091]MBP1168235.1 competence protein ComEA [Paenibacillus sp. PvR098]MBP2439263.1 competence protein ComEA [Paenibacillus sp. PvP052]